MVFVSFDPGVIQHRCRGNGNAQLESGLLFNSSGPSSENGLYLGSGLLFITTHKGDFIQAVVQVLHIEGIFVVINSAHHPRRCELVTVHVGEEPNSSNRFRDGAKFSRAMPSAPSHKRL